jgi:hypothetical protein
VKKAPSFWLCAAITLMSWSKAPFKGLFPGKSGT